MQSRKKMLAAGATAAVMALGLSAPGALAQTEDESVNVNALNDVANVSETLNGNEVANDFIGDVDAANVDDTLNVAGNETLNGNDVEAANGDINAANGNDADVSADGNDVSADGNSVDDNDVDASDTLDVNDTLDSVISLD